MECEIDFASFRRYTLHKAKQMKFAMHGGRSVEDDGEVYSDSADRPFRDAAVLFFLPVQKQSSAVSGAVCVLSDLHAAPFSAGRDDGSSQLCRQYAALFLSGKQMETRARKGHVRRSLSDAAVRACAYMVRVDVCFAGCGKHCLDDCGVYG